MEKWGQSKIDYEKTVIEQVNLVFCHYKRNLDPITAVNNKISDL